MKFIVDAQLPRVLALRFIELGHDAIHVNELPNGGDTRDSEITAFADETGRVVVTKDNDFRHTHVAAGRPSRLLFITLGNLRNRDLPTHVTTHQAAIVDSLDRTAFVKLGESGLTLHGSFRSRP